MTGVKAATRSAGAKSRPTAARAVGGSRAAAATPIKAAKEKARVTRSKEVKERAQRIASIRARRNIARVALAGAAGAAAGAGLVAAALAPRAPSAAAPPGGAPTGPGGAGASTIGPSTVSGMVTIKTASGKSFVVAEQYVQNFKGFVDELEASGYKINSIGGYANRNIAGTGKKSFHSLGVAIDINPSTNPHLFDGRLVTDMPSNVGAMARKYGLGWGGDWRSSKDAMHFSIASAEGGSLAIDRSGVAPLPGAPQIAGATPTLPVGAGGPSAMGASPQAAAAPAPGQPTTQPGGNPSVKEVAQYIASKAQSMGVDPNLALGIAAYEGLNPNTIGSPTFGNRDAKGYSFGPFQLYSGSPDPSKIARGGMAAEFMQRYGEAPSATNWRQQVDFSLELMRRRGPAGLERGPWYAVRDRGGVANITRLGAQYAAQQKITPGEISTPSPASQVAAGAPQATTPTLPTGPGGPSPSAVGPQAAPAPASGGASPPQNVTLGSKVDLSKVDPDLLQRFYQAAQEYGKPVTINSGYRGDEYQAELWVRANIFREPGIYSPAKPQNTTTITYQGKQYTVEGGGRGSAHGRGQALDVSPGPAMDPFLRKHGLHRPHASFDPPHVQKIGGEEYAAASQVPTGAPQATTPRLPTAGGGPPPSATRPQSAPAPAPQQQALATLSQRNAVQESAAQSAGQQVIIMNNERMINNTRTIYQQQSRAPSRGRPDDFNPLVLAGAAAGLSIAKALRIF
jgi:hypothetical protein